MLNQYFCLLFKQKEDNVFSLFAYDKLLSNLKVNKDEVKQNLLEINIFTSASFENLNKNVLKKLAEKIGLSMLIFNKTSNIKEIL